MSEHPVNDDWTPIERRALTNLARALKNMPPAIHLYELDGAIIACKQGIPSYDLSRTLPGSITATVVITDAHDHCAERMEASHDD